MRRHAQTRVHARPETPMAADPTILEHGILHQPNQCLSSLLAVARRVYFMQNQQHASAFSSHKLYIGPTGLLGKMPNHKSLHLF